MQAGLNKISLYENKVFNNLKENKMEDKKKEVKEVHLNVEQILNELQISGRNRDVIVSKYSKRIMHKVDWEKLLKNI